MSIGIPFRARIVALLLALPLTGCLFRSHRVTPQFSTAELQTASAADLIARVNSMAQGIHTLNAVVDIATSVGGEKTGKVTEYQEIRGYILVRQPSSLRMIGLMPVIRNHAFDMVSEGSAFKLWIPPKNKFYIGRNDAAAPGTSGLTGLRPQIIYDSLLLNGIAPNEDLAVLESGMETVVDPNTHKNRKQPDYRLDILHRGAKGWALARKIYFNRVDLQPRRQIVYDVNGGISTQDRYDGWKPYGGIWFPSVIEIERPVEEYEITIGLVKLSLNEPLTDEQFELTQPPGAQVVQLDGAPTPTAAQGGERSGN